MYKILNDEKLMLSLGLKDVLIDLLSSLKN